MSINQAYQTIKKPKKKKEPPVDNENPSSNALDDGGDIEPIIESDVVIEIEETAKTDFLDTAHVKIGAVLEILVAQESFTACALLINGLFNGQEREVLYAQLDEKTVKKIKAAA